MRFSLLYRTLFAAIRCLMVSATVDAPLEGEIDCVVGEMRASELTEARCASVAPLTGECLVRAGVFRRSVDRSIAIVRWKFTCGEPYFGMEEQGSFVDSGFRIFESIERGWGGVLMC